MVLIINNYKLIMNRHESLRSFYNNLSLQMNFGINFSSLGTFELFTFF